MTTLLPFPRLRPGFSVPAEATARDQLVLADSYGRVASDLRVSLTDRCNLRCAYCMPPEGLDWLPGADVLTDDEIVRLITIGVELLGIKTVRLTGGEPLLRKNLELLVGDIAALSPVPEVALTTNGIGLAARAEKLATAGLRRINVSLDTLDPETFAKISRRRRLPDVLAGITAAREAGLQPIKINTVLLRGVNDHEAFDLLQWAMAERVQLRFIEQMPLDPQHGWKRDEMITAAEIKQQLGQHVELIEDPKDALTRGSAPAELFRVAGTNYSVGIIASVTQPFCAACDRVRLTADGQIRNCLFARTESDLRTPLRSGASDAELAALWVAAVADKKPGHGINDASFLQPDRPMSAIGG
ncbi:MAG TPA: GTP 3',8-cyclase MoaA [Propionibacteriaceae bacterium]